jgi:hypothetical protein
MVGVVGIFDRREAAEKAANDLRSLEADNSTVHLLRPGATPEELNAVPTAGSEGPGMGRTIAAFLGGVLGIALGLALGAIGGLPLGLVTAAILGTVGILAGNVLGKRWTAPVFDGVPKDELLFYEDALRHGRSVVICLTDKDFEAQEARGILEREGAESIDQAHQNWTLGLEDDSKEARFKTPPKHVNCDRDSFQQGLEAARDPEFHGKPWDQVAYLLAERYPCWTEDNFRNGFDAGQRS